ncbi:type VI secretion system baseplate subunit TssG [Acinetobacter pragensis]|uniref:Type VI secretion protein n=1 Tax=Acinetobacter pragensis TaxID=1806892 RepID=A0A151Y2Z5_9GAMM|nr:type VI secretion system baseplate subunit TssG [Acinetobacter pragensis]KYQ72390.1 type VI secretion protein [Acinetobacter pragensis]
MHAERWWQEASVIEDLLKNPASFEFIQAARLLRHMPYADADQYWAANFQFNSSLKLNFPQSEIESLQIERGQVHLTNLVVGLTGMQGALPYSYTNKIKSSSRQPRTEAQQFLNLFNHKLTAQYVDASINYNLPLRYEIDHENKYLDIIHALNGYIKNQHHPQDMENLVAEFSGLMQGQNNSVYALKTMLRCIFDVNVDVLEFIPAKFNLSAEHKSCLGRLPGAALGVNTFCGETVHQIDDRIELLIGPLNRKDYLDFLPQGSMSEKLKQIISMWCSPTLLVEVRLILKKEDIKPVCLSSNSVVGLSQATVLSSDCSADNAETCYALIGDKH